MKINKPGTFSKHRMQIKKNRFEIHKKVGSGTYASVYKCFDNKLLKTIAVKKLKLSCIENYGIPGIVLREISILTALDHPGVIKLLDVIFLKEILLVFDYMDQNLNSFLKEKEQSDFLSVSEIQVNAGTMLKRFLPAPQGRAYRLRKRSNHVTIKVNTKGAPAVDAPVEEVEATEEA